jgi:hypothetical protein
MDVLNLSDPNSDLFDNEEYNIQKEIEQLSLSVSKRAAAFLIRSFQPSCFSFCHFSFFLPFVQLLSLTAMHSIPLRAVHSTPLRAVHSFVQPYWARFSESHPVEKNSNFKI